MTEAEFDMIRTVLGFRLIGLPPSYVAYATRIKQAAVKRILLAHGDVPFRGRGRHWRGPFSITPEKRRWLSLPPYIPLSVDGSSSRVENGVAWMALTKDTPVIRMPDGSRKLYGGDEPFHRSQGFNKPPPE